MAGVEEGSALLRSSLVVRVGSSTTNEVVFSGMGASAAAGLAGWETGGGCSGVVAHAESVRITNRELKWSNFMV